MMNAFFLLTHEGPAQRAEPCTRVQLRLAVDALSKRDSRASFAPQLMMHEQREQKNDRKRNSD
jgi:hypothetical protein